MSLCSNSANQKLGSVKVKLSLASFILTSRCLCTITWVLISWLYVIFFLMKDLNLRCIRRQCFYGNMTILAIRGAVYLS